ncbi:MAG TPA: hypothetical protein VG796_25960 [Verrucomicrobiales bacterium]|jgi:hypothetical protein|nr:hypothetical protein [Verrucomicrobiales bacterium]
MKHILQFLLCSFALLLSAKSADVPEAVTHELQTIRKAISYACTELPDHSETDRYWASMKELGKLAKETPAPAWMAALDPLEQRIAALALDHYEHPILAETLFKVYPRYKEDVPPKIAPRLQELLDEHVTKEYRGAWEAWILAPGSREKGRMIGAICAALGKCGTEDSVRSVMAAVEQSPVGDVKGAMPLEFEKYAGKALLNLRFAASLEGLLQLVETGVKRSRSPFLGVRDKEFQNPKTSQKNAEQSFIVLVSGYEANRGANVSPFIHREGKLWLPAIETLLKKPELKPEHRTLLEKTKGVIEKFCMQ